MIWNTVDVLAIFCAGKIAGKLAWKILNELGVCWVGIGLVLCPFSCDVFAMYWPRTPPLAPSDVVLEVVEIVTNQLGDNMILFQHLLLHFNHLCLRRLKLIF